MSRSRSFATFMFAFLIGAVAGGFAVFMLWQPSTDKINESGNPTKAVLNNLGADRTSPTVGNTNQNRQPTASDTRPEQNPISLNDPAVLIQRAASLIEATPPQGPGSLTVALREDGVMPMSGVEVVLIQDPLQSGSAALRTGLLGLGDTAGAVKRLVQSRHTMSAGRTDAQGNFTFAGIANMTHVLWVGLEGYRLSCEGYPTDSETMVVARVAPGPSLIISASKKPIVEFDIRLPDGTQPERALLHLRSLHFMASPLDDRWWTPSSRVFQLYGGHYAAEAYVISAADRDYELGYDDALEFTVEGRLEQPLVTLRLVPLVTVKGRYLFQGDRRPVSVHLVERKGKEELDRDTLVNGYSTDWPDYEYTDVGRDAGLDYVFDVRVPGDYWLFAGEGDHIVAHAPITIGTQSVRVDLAMPPHSQDTQLQLRVIDGNGQLVRKPRFNIWVDIPENWDSTEFSPPIQPDGTYFVPIPVSAKQYQTHPWLVRVQSDDHAWEEFKVPNPSKGIVELRLSPRANVNILFAGLGKDLSPYIDNELTYRDSNPASEWLWIGRDSQRRRNSTDAGVVARFEGLLPGHYKVTTKLRRRLVSIELSVHETEFDLVAGENNVVVEGMNLHTLTLTFAHYKEVVAGTLFLDSEDGEPEGLSSTSTPPLVFDGVPNGNYLVRVKSAGKGYTFMRVKVSGPTVVAFSGAPPNRLRAWSPGSDIPNIEAGTVIISIDGRPCWDVEETTTLLKSLEEREISVEVLRRGEVVVIYTTASKLLENCFSWSRKTMPWFG